MRVESISSQSNSLLESAFVRENVNNQISVSVLQQMEDIQASQEQALVQMINQSTLQGTGQLVNLLA